MKHMYYEVFEQLIEKYKSVKNLWNTSFDDINKCEFINYDIKQDFMNFEYRANLDKYVEYMKNNNIELVTCFEENYPMKLQFIKNRPIVLYYKGNISSINKESVAIVGSRNCTQYGRNCAKLFAGELAYRNLNIVSGLALGIDAVAHCEALNKEGKTFAVVGNGLDRIYPKENYLLAQRILDGGGAIISEFVVGTKPEKQNFPRRNRIISGISNAIIVIEASKKSGSLITANYAINQGREVWVVPGSIFCKNAEGTNELIKDGANILTNVNDIIKDEYS